jgi:ATP-binding cassette subfamily B protein
LPPIQAAGEGPRRKLIDASEVVFRYRPEGQAILQGLDLTVYQGERILLEGASGGGKSTLAALLTGLRMPESGLLLLNGLDRSTLGPGWHQLATEAPQFHENHILTGSLAFNLLMGRNWPPSVEDLTKARALCVELGLGALLDRMPAGLLQQVGETGWQLSHGERSRVFLARALLQNARLTILDESFAALDPETLKACLQSADTHAHTLVVIAHP